MTKLLLLRSEHSKNYQRHHSEEHLKVSDSSAIRNGQETFHGICIDTGASFHSVAGLTSISLFLNFKIL